MWFDMVWFVVIWVLDVNWLCFGCGFDGCVNCVLDVIWM
jgi:hypothetical protein